MRITRRTSGGRGEYEISEPSPEELTPTDLLNRRLTLQLTQNWIIDTGTALTSQGGKRRLRLLGGTPIHLHRQIAAALLLPHPIRADEPLGRGAPVAKQDQYAIENIELASAELIGSSGARLQVREIYLRNRTYAADELGVGTRISDLAQLWDRSVEFPDNIASLLNQHKEIVTSGQPIPDDAEDAVLNLQKVVSQISSDLGIVYYGGITDVSRPLLEALKTASIPPEPPIAVAEVDPEEIEIRRRTLKQWKRWSNARGSASARFRQLVRTAYNSTCVVCGLHLPVTRYNPVPGVDAAHILPWADYDLDHVSNGLCLCRLHHWAFDEGLVVITFEDGRYNIGIPDEVQAGIRDEVKLFSLDELLRYAGPIPEARLPRQRAQRPRPEFLDELNRVT
jgi:putative restriction endonuclease